MAFNNYLFDLDDTLAPTGPIHLEAFRRTFSSFGVTFLDDLESIKGKTTENILQHYDFLELEMDAVINAKRLEYKRLALDHLTPNPVVTDLLVYLLSLGSSLGIVSNGSRSSVSFTLQRLQIENLFSSVITSDDVVLGKPSPEGIISAMASLRCSSTEVIMIDDSLAGLEAAHSAGVASIGIGCKIDSSLFSVSDIAELSLMIKKMRYL